MDNEHKTAAKQILLTTTSLIGIEGKGNVEVGTALALAQVHATLALVQAVENLGSLSGQAVSPLS